MSELTIICKKSGQMAHFDTYNHIDSRVSKHQTYKGCDMGEDHLYLFIITKDTNHGLNIRDTKENRDKLESMLQFEIGFKLGGKIIFE